MISCNGELDRAAHAPEPFLVLDKEATLREALAPVVPMARPGAGSTAVVADEESFRQIFDEFLPRLRSFFLASGFQASDADDLSQAAMWNVYRSREEFRGDGSLDGWIYAIARNVARDEWRRRGRAAETEPVGEVVADESPSAETLANDRQEVARLGAALRSLPTGMRTCLLMHVQQGLSYQAIAERLNLALPTVKVQIWNARRRLRSLLEAGR